VAEAVVAIYHGASLAEQARKNFDQTFKEGNVAESLWQERRFDRAQLPLREIIRELQGISASAADRLIVQKAVRVDGDLADQAQMELDISNGCKIEIGKHGFFKVSKK
jgi:tyrosyl-tRNA synthetase